MRTDRRTRDVAIRKWIEQVASRMGLLPYLHFNPRQLSSGQRQRVVLGRAISRQPQVYLMDEPLANLDATMRVAMRAELRNLHQRSGVTTIYVTHDQAEAMILGNRIAVMKDGVLQQIDTPQELYLRPKNMFVAGFVGSPEMNMLQVHLEANTEGLFLNGDGFRLRVPDYIAGRIMEREDNRVVLGLRPEAIHDARFMPEADPDTVIDTRVEMVESMGRDVYYELVAGTQPLRARMDDRTIAAPGHTLRVVFETEKIYLFDPVSQRSLL
jgi:multiple sugar transport system ATP-binding protein